jgi:alkaline phosphatase D
MLGRRELIRGAVWLAAARFLGAGPGVGAGQVARPRDYPFPLGVASGEPSEDGFMMWTRVPGQAGDIRLGYEIAEDEGFRHIVRKGQVLAPATRGGAAHVEVAGLRPGRHYHYRFHFGDAVSPVGRTLTVDPAPDRLRLALTSCQHWEQGWFSGYADMIGQGMDAVLQVGDYIYERSFGNGPDVRRFGLSEPRDLADYRARHALYRTDPHLAAAHAAMPFLVTWDDHEVENDYAGGEGSVTGDPAAFLRRRAAAYQAYFEHMPLRPASLLGQGDVRLYRRVGWGRLATLHILDTRQYRTPQPCSLPGKRGGAVQLDCAAAFDPAASMLGGEQEAWLTKGLAEEKARWSLIAQGTLFSRLALPQGPEAYYSDVWDGYRVSRDRVIGALSNPAVRNPVILGGDVHSFWINDVKRDFSTPGSATVATELVTTCLASRNGPQALFEGAEQRNPHVRFHDNAHAGYVALDVTPAAIEADLRVVGDLTDPESRCSSLKRFTIADGKAGAVAG